MISSTQAMCCHLGGPILISVQNLRTDVHQMNARLYIEAAKQNMAV